jgi:hypothetical protein
MGKSSTYQGRSSAHPVKVALGLLVAIIAAGVLNTVLALFARSLGASPKTVQGLNPSAYLTLTTVGVLVGAVGWAVVRARTKNPSAVLSWLVPVAVVVSFAADVPLFFVPGASPVGVIALMLMHVVVAANAVPVYRRVLPLPITVWSSAPIAHVAS